jgi:hypothetical protein
LIFDSEDEKTVYTRCGVWEKFKKTGLVKEMLGRLGNLTPERLCAMSVLFSIQGVYAEILIPGIRGYWE